MATNRAPGADTANRCDVLLVEDNPMDVQLTKAAFEAAGIAFDPHVARDGKEALDYLFRRGAFARATTPDVVLLDLNIPLFSGLDVLQQAKASEATRRIPIVVLTMSQSPHDIARAYEKGAAAYLSKPVDFEEFVEMVKAIAAFWFRKVTYPARAARGSDPVAVARPASRPRTP